MLKSYLREIFDTAIHGDATEPSFYPTLAGMLNNYADSVGREGIDITTLPKKTEAGNPDFRIWDGKEHIIGYIEAKAPSMENLDIVETSEQLKRYLDTFPNLILTNFFEFRLYRNGILWERAQIGRPALLFRAKTIPPVENEAAFFTLLDKFLSFRLPQVEDAEALSIELAKRTRFLRDEVVGKELEEQENDKSQVISGLYEAFSDFLMGNLSKGEFADLFSQTITYGLFVARTRAEDGFNRRTAYEHIPPTIGILRNLFQLVSIGKLPQPMEWLIDDISEVLSVTDVKQILRHYSEKGKGKDPIFHFYETFLARYNPKLREERGVYYTPESVVSYIVRSLNRALKEHFHRMNGFASDGVTVLDPAAGTLTFLASAVKLAVEEFVLKYGEGGRENFLREHVLENFYALELMMAPYAAGHLKMSFLLEELGYKLGDNERFKFFLTNTLDFEKLTETKIPILSAMSRESQMADEIKREKPILIILGNPPYHGRSYNKSKWIMEEIRTYYWVDGKPLGERNPKWLQDDYVKFIRFAQRKIDLAGEGILGFITNHAYLDNPTFRGMRRSLMNSFDEIYVLDLHGNSKKKEICPDGSKDENVFDIQQGVAIGIFIKKKTTGEKGCVVFHSNLWGTREEKYRSLMENDIKSIAWQKITPKSELYLFVPREESLLAFYETHPKITDILTMNNVGTVTARDNYVICRDKEELKRRIRAFRDDKVPDDFLRLAFNLNDKPNWRLHSARERVKTDEKWQESIKQILYRPFDIRWIFYDDALVERSRREIMRHMTQDNLAIVLPKRVETRTPWQHVICTNQIIDHVVVSLKTIDYLFPLHIYGETEEKLLYESSRKPEKGSNVNGKIMTLLSSAYRIGILPERIFYYVYSVLYSTTYREKYSEFLKLDFPRIPFPRDYSAFARLSEYGERLAELHLLRSPDLESSNIRFPMKGDNRIEKLKFDAREERLFFNSIQYFEGIKKEVWQYQIGGYHVCHTWLKHRKGQALSLEDIKQFCNIATALERTIDIQKAIDEIYPEIEKNALKIERNEELPKKRKRKQDIQTLMLI